MPNWTNDAASYMVLKDLFGIPPKVLVGAVRSALQELAYKDPRQRHTKYGGLFNGNGLC
jgi:hypothetical protein